MQQNNEEVESSSVVEKRLSKHADAGVKKVLYSIKPKKQKERCSKNARANSGSVKVILNECFNE